MADCRRICLLVDAGEDGFYVVGHVHLGAEVPEPYRGRRPLTSARLVAAEKGVEAVELRERSGRRLRIETGEDGPLLTQEG